VTRGVVAKNWRSVLQHEIDLASSFAQRFAYSVANGLVLGVVTERENPADALVVSYQASDQQIDTLPDGQWLEHPLYGVGATAARFPTWL